MKISEKIMMLRKQQGWSQEMLANELGVSRQTVYKWENDLSKPELEQIKRLTQLFNVSYELLLNEKIDEMALPNEHKAERILYRDVFDSKKVFGNDIVMREHGYQKTAKGYKFTQRKRRGYKGGYTSHTTEEKKEEEIFFIYRDSMWEYFKKNNYCDFFTLAPNVNFSFFIDEKNNAFGFYFDGCEQFVCPFENFIDIVISDSGYGARTIRKPMLGIGTDGSFAVGSTTENIMSRPDFYYIAISYFDRNGNICIYKQSVSATYDYFLFRNENIDIYKEIITPIIANALNELRAKLAAVKEKGKLIRQDKIVVSDLDITAYERRFIQYETDKKRKEQHNNEELQKNITEQKRLNKNMLIVLGIIFVFFSVIMAIATSGV